MNLCPKYYYKFLLLVPFSKLFFPKLFFLKVLFQNFFLLEPFFLVLPLIPLIFSFQRYCRERNYLPLFVWRYRIFFVVFQHLLKYYRFLFFLYTFLSLQFQFQYLSSSSHQYQYHLYVYFHCLLSKVYFFEDFQNKIFLFFFQKIFLLFQVFLYVRFSPINQEFLFELFYHKTRNYR